MPAMDSDADAVWAVVLDMYDAFLAGDRERLEANLDPQCTLRDPATPTLLSKQELQRIRRSSPPSDEPRPTALVADPLRVAMFGDTAVEAHQLRAEFAEPVAAQHFRCSSTLRLVDGRWLIVHHHEEQRGSG